MPATTHAYTVCIVGGSSSCVDVPARAHALLALPAKLLCSTQLPLLLKTAAVIAVPQMLCHRQNTYLCWYQPVLVPRAHAPTGLPTIGATEEPFPVLLPLAHALMALLAVICIDAVLSQLCICKHAAAVQA
jgi:hypothetical protein